MSNTLSLNPPIEQGVGCLFIKERHGQSTVVELIRVKPRKVTLRSPGRVDLFTLSVEEFRKHYTLKSCPHTPVMENTNACPA